MTTPMGAQASTPVRVAIVAEHASERFGGEAFLPLHYFRRLRARGVEAWLVSHARVREELLDLLPGEADRMHFVADTSLQVGLWKFGERLPAQVAEMTSGAASHLFTQVQQRRVVRHLVRSHGVNVVHEPIPVSPTQPSALWDVEAPVIIGPMNGGMTYPPGFSERQQSSEKIAHRAARSAANVANLLIPGKRSARLLLVANERTRAALPSVLRDVPIEELVENGVDFENFSPRQARESDETLRVAFVGRLVGWKAVDILLDALGRARSSSRIALEIFGDGPLRKDLERQAAELGLNGAVTFHGFLRQEEIAARLRHHDALVLPSLFECGGAVVLEAMAMALPVIATRWGGPAEYLDERCGILVDPESPEQMTRDLADAMVRLNRDRGLADAMGRAGRDKVREYDWNRKIDRILAIYQGVVTESDGAAAR